MDVHPYLVFGGGSETTCAALLARRSARGADAEAGAPGPFTAPLPGLLAGTLDEPHSYLAAVTGCAAALPRASDSGPDPVCGDDSTGEGPGLSLVRLSRQTSRLDVGFQVIHASQASPSLSVEIDELSTGSRLAAFGPLEFGQLVPPGQPTYVPRVSLSQGPTRYAVRVSAGSRSFPLTTLASIFDSSGLSGVDFGSDNLLTLVLLGASPGLDSGQPGQPSQVAAVRSTQPIPNDGARTGD
jgi:hypothetical protein